MGNWFNMLVSIIHVNVALVKNKATSKHSETEYSLEPLNYSSKQANTCTHADTHFPFSPLPYFWVTGSGKGQAEQQKYSRHHTTSARLCYRQCSWCNPMEPEGLLTRHIDNIHQASAVFNVGFRGLQNLYRGTRLARVVLQVVWCSCPVYRVW